MKKLFTLLLLFGITSLSAQEADHFTDNQSDLSRDPRTDLMNFVPNEVLVKFKDDVAITSGTQLKSAGVSSVDKVLKAAGGSTLEKLFPLEKKLKSAQYVKDPQGREMKIPSLHNIYKIVIPQTKSSGSMPADIFKVIEELKALPEVEYAEPNYILSIDNSNPIGPILSANDILNMQDGIVKNSETGLVPNDPLFGQQTYIQAVKADLVWDQTTGDTSQIIAILDTGIDWLHPDLKNKIWSNKAEIPGNGVDDDGNGLVDDTRGWDYINNDNNPMDDNSHGTHVAGIAAAEGNNGIGISGVCPKAKIMAIKVFPSSGRTDISTIVPGIYYAANNGATVINMSFGEYGRSQTLETALLYAYSKNIILVAAAGNDSYSIYDQLPGGFPAIFYPAGLPYVFGVQSDGDYSNFDPDGPVYSQSAEGMNYELKAPGSIFSTVPNGNYRTLQGTSMASPIVAGAVALYRSLFPEKSLEELWSDFIHSSTGVIDLNEAFFGSAKVPQLDLMSYILTDTNPGDDNDGQADGGEIIDLVIQIRNTGSPAEDVYVKITQSNDGDPRDITILKDSVNFGSIGIYQTKNNYLVPFKVKINSNCFHNRTITLDVTIKNAQNTELFTQNLKFKIYNGEELSGIINTDTILTPDKNWVITNSLRISQGVNVTILPGTHVEINAGVDNRGKVIAIGSPDCRISMKGIIGGDATYKYADLDLNGGGMNATIIDNCNISNLSSFSANKISYSKISNFDSNTNGRSFSCDSIYRCLFENSILYYFQGNLIESVANDFTIAFSNTNLISSKYNVFDKMRNLYVWCYPNRPDIYNMYPTFLFVYGQSQRKILKNTFLGNGISSYFIKTDGNADMISLPDQYWGTTNNSKIKPKYYDFWESAGLPYFNCNPQLIAPSDSCQAHVWKVIVNGKDAQDEVVEPIGVGKQRFDVYFNRPMNKTIIPQISFGGLYPYTSNSINEDGLWSDDGKIYTVFKTIKLTIADGINRIRVAGAKQDADWGWEIPVEDQRFNFIISATGSASIEFMATPGLGKVNLEWNNNQLADGLGFNMYRMEQINDSTLSMPLLINSTLIADTLYTDFAVTPNKKYYYYYKILRTNLAETDSSKVVSTIPLTASKGDANGDLTVNVLDITTLVSYLLNQNPQPFIAEAADVNLDGQVNVLDIIGVVKVISGGKKKISSTAATNPTPAYIYLEPDKIKLRSDEQVAGLQFALTGSKLKEVKLSSLLEGFEFAYFATDTTITGILFSYSGKTIPRGLQDILKIEAGSALLIWGDVMGGDNAGKYVTIIKSGEVVPVPEIFLVNAFPNPSSGEITIGFDLPEKAKVTFSIFNLYGQLITTLEDANLNFGSHEVRWQPGAAGIYICRLQAIGTAENKQQYSKDIKLIMIK